MDDMKNDLREKLAAIEHERWADWQKWVHKQLRRPYAEEGAPWILPDEIFERWQRQIYTSYYALTPEEKASDMEQVDRYWPLIEEYVLALLDEVMGKVVNVDGEKEYSAKSAGDLTAVATAGALNGLRGRQVLAIQAIRDSVSGGKSGE